MDVGVAGARELVAAGVCGLLPPTSTTAFQAWGSKCLPWTRQPSRPPSRVPGCCGPLASLGGPHPSCRSVLTAVLLRPLPAAPVLVSCWVGLVPAKTSGRVLGVRLGNNPRDRCFGFWAFAKAPTPCTVHAPARFFDIICVSSIFKFISIFKKFGVKIFLVASFFFDAPTLPGFSHLRCSAFHPAVFSLSLT